MTGRDLSRARWSLCEPEPGEWRGVQQARHTGALGHYWSSPVAADGKILLAREEGRVVVLRAAQNGRSSPSTASARTPSPHRRFSMDGSTSAPAKHCTVSQNGVFEFDGYVLHSGHHKILRPQAVFGPYGWRQPAPHLSEAHTQLEFFGTRKSSQGWLATMRHKVFLRRGGCLLRCCGGLPSRRWRRGRSRRWRHRNQATRG